MNLSYNTHFKSQRPDGCLTSSLAAHMEQMRRTKPLLALPNEISPEEFPVWKKNVCEKIRELLLMPNLPSNRNRFVFPAYSAMGMPWKSGNYIPIPSALFLFSC